MALINAREDLTGQSGTITAEPTPMQMISARTNKPYVKWIFPTSIKTFEVMDAQLLQLQKEYGQETKNWIGKRFKIESENDGKYKQYIFFPMTKVEEEVVR